MWSRSQLTWQTINICDRWLVEQATRLARTTQIMPPDALPAQKSAYSWTIAESWNEQQSLWCMNMPDTINMNNDSLSLMKSRCSQTRTHTISSRSSVRFKIKQLELRVIPEWLCILYSNITSAKAFKSDSSVSERVIWADSVSQWVIWTGFMNHL